MDPIWWWVIAAVVLIALVLVLVPRMRRRQEESRRQQAAEVREEAQEHSHVVREREAHAAQAEAEDPDVQGARDRRDADGDGRADRGGLGVSCVPCAVRGQISVTAPGSAPARSRQVASGATAPEGVSTSSPRTKVLVQESASAEQSRYPR